MSNQKQRWYKPAVTTAAKSIGDWLIAADPSHESFDPKQRVVSLILHSTDVDVILKDNHTGVEITFATTDAPLELASDDCLGHISLRSGTTSNPIIRVIQDLH